MADKAANRKRRINLVAGVILGAGLLAAALIYLGAENEPDSEAIRGLQLEESKRYVHDLELYGGKANVIASDFRRWLEGLLAGKRLALTVAFGSAAASASFLFLANRWEGGPHPASPDERRQPEK